MTTLACMVSQKSLTTKFIFSKYGKKENWTNTRKNMHEKAGSQYHDTIHHYQPAYQIWLLCSSLQSFTEIFDKKIIIQIMERNKIGLILGRISMKRLVAISQCSISLSSSKQNMTTPACMVSQKSLTKKFIIQSMERKKIGHIQGRISIKRLVCNSAIQYIIINLHTKYDYSSLHSFTEIFDNKFHYSKHGKKENRTKTERISIRRLVCNPAKQYIIINLHNKSLTKNFIIQSI